MAKSVAEAEKTKSEKKKKQEEKRLRKLEKKNIEPKEGPGEPRAEGEIPQPN